MKGCRLLSLLLLLACVLTLHADEPTRKQVLQLLVDPNSLAEAESARAKMQAYGTNAIPILIEVVGYTEAQFEKLDKKVYGQTSGEVFKEPVLKDWQQLASQMFLSNMPETSLYLTNLFPLLRDSRVEVRRNAASLINIHSSQTNQHLLPDVLLALKDTDFMVRHSIAGALSKGAAALPRVRIALEGALSDSNEGVRLEVAKALLKVDKKHLAAQQALKELFYSANEYCSSDAAGYYMDMTLPYGELEDELIPILVASSYIHPNDKYGLLYWGLGDKSHITRDRVLQKFLLSSDLKVRIGATNALQRIAPEVLRP